MKRGCSLLLWIMLLVWPTYAQAQAVINPPPVPACTTGQILIFNGSIWECGSAGAGTVTSVGLTVPTGLSVSGSPVTGSGTLAVSLTSGYVIPGGGTSGQILRSQGASAPAFSTATYPATGGTAGTFLRSDGTNWANSTLVLPNAATSGDLLVASGSNTIGAQAPAALTRTDDANVTLTLGGSASTALVNAASITAGWTGTLSMARGGTAANLTAADGGIVYSTDTTLAITAAGTTGQVLTSNGTSPPTWEDATAGGTVTSVAATVPTGLSISGSPITTSGTLAFTLTSGYMIPGGGTSGQVLRSQGASAPAFSTATYPATATTSGAYLRADGTNWITSTLVLPNAATTGDLLVASGSNTIGAQAPAALTRTNDTNVTLTLGGSATTALVNAASITAGWSGTLAMARGGSAANLTAEDGGIVYSTDTALAITAAGTTGQVLTSNGTDAPTWEDAAGGGTVTSVAMTVPTGLSVAGSPITGSGTLAVSLTSGYMIPGGGSAGQYLQSNGASAPTFSTATLPSTATGTGKILRADGTNWVATTATFPDTATTTGAYLRADGTNWISSTLILPNAITANRVVYASATDTYGSDADLTFDGTTLTATGLAVGSMSNGGLVYSTATSMAILAAGSAGQIPRSGGAGAPSWSTATYPSTVTSGHVMVASGTNVWAGQAPAALTKTDDTNVTLTLGGSHATSLINAASLTLGWTGTLAGSRGGTGYSSVKNAGIAYGLSTNYIDGTGTAGTDNTAQTVKTIAVGASTLTQVGDRLHVSILYRPDTGTALNPSVTLNGVTVCSSATSTSAAGMVFEVLIDYIDSTHANVHCNRTLSNGALSTLVTGVNVAGFDWTASQDLDVDQDAQANNRIIVFSIVGTVKPKGVAAG